MIEDDMHLVRSSRSQAVLADGYRFEIRIFRLRD